MREDRMVRRSSFGKSIRKRLSDITNYQPQPKSPPVFDQILPFTASSFSTKEHIDHLLKENAGLMQLITEKNKVIEMNGVELQKLRIVLQKTQLQNWNLAQSNSHMMAELNIGKKKLKELQHQLTCKDALLKTMNSELQVKREMNDQNGETKDGENAHTRQQNTNRRIRQARSQSTGHLTTVQQVSEKEIAENKRRCVRRQSARFTSQEHELNENLFEIKDLKMQEDYYGATSKVIKQEDDRIQEDDECGLKPESQRMSFGRPSRKAAEKIQSYKEIPIKQEDDHIQEDDKCGLKPESQRMSFGRPSRKAAEKIQSYKEIPIKQEDDRIQEDDECGLKPESQRMSFGRPSRKAAEKIQSYKEIPIKQEDDHIQEDDKCGLKPESQRMSFGRPSRKAAEKIQSYKEVPINIKMRRPE